MSHQPHRKDDIPSEPDQVADDSENDGDDDSSPNTDYENLTAIFGEKLVQKKVNLFKKVVGIRDSKDEELVKLLEPQEDDYDDDVNINQPGHQKVEIIRVKKLMAKITENKVYVTDDKENLPKDKNKVTADKQNIPKDKYKASEEKYDADVDTQTSNEDVIFSRKNVASTAKKILKSGFV